MGLILGVKRSNRHRMDLPMRHFFLATLISLSACGGSASTSDDGFEATEAALADGRLRFEVRGLANEGTAQSTGATDFSHRGTVLALGDTNLTSKSYLVFFAIERVSGGDPETRSTSNRSSSVVVERGAGRFQAYGGYRLQSERWSPEAIKVRPTAVIPLINPSDSSWTQE